ncbi:hypothetical protein KJ742_02725 [Patescibacteria group bacterium]|nr:hypothetical protein [Patescibacteria group bacterium]MBU1682835.1 hypothetical protein [Patescibacteria group bacterium]MBU1935622.1 hypothetical protein [Patescibacteria group bacterium]
MDDQTDPNASAQTGGQPIPPPPPPPAGDQGATPAAGQPPAGSGAAAGQKDLSGIMEENVDISGLVANAGNQQQQQDFLTSVKIPPHPNTTFDEQKFVQLLAGSISLTITEKKRIIEAVPQLSQFQIDELIKIFEEEKGKFAELEKKHTEQIKELEEKHKGSWEDLEAQKEEEKKKGEEEQEAEDIKKQLGL